MHRTEFTKLQRRLLEHVNNGTTDQADDVFTVPVAEYLDPELWQREMDLIFKRKPLMLSLSCELSGPNTYKALDVLGVPVVITRDGDGVAHAFLNACRHRGAEIVSAGCGEARRLTCPYHAWTYDMTGALAGIHGKESFGDVDMGTLGLTELWCDETAGMIFVCITPGVTHNLREWLAGFDDLVAPFEMEKWHVFSRRELAGPNWKVCYDGYLEGYHFASLHRETIFKLTMSNIMAYDNYGPHQRIGFPRHEITGLRNKPESDWEPFEGLSLVCTIFPNISFAFSSDGVMMSQLFPGPTPSQSRTVQTIARIEPFTTEEERVKAESRSDFYYDVVRDEDYATGLGIQRGLASGANTEFTFGRNELGLHVFHRSVEQYAELR
jgi:phenylpropionate dioxygenase-like ring-hydroxylating dioxygenase large terminal subunit